jgi:hypothetical protein
VSPTSAKKDWGETLYPIANAYLQTTNATESLFKGFDSRLPRQYKTFETAQRASKAPRAPHHAGLFAMGS